jgi:hypothetical protein
MAALITLIITAVWLAVCIPFVRHLETQREIQRRLLEIILEEGGPETW